MGKFFLPKATTTEREALTPDDGTILYDETEQMLYFGDGSTVGGNTLQGDVGPQGPPGTLTAVVDDTTPQLGGFLDPNGNFIGMDQGGDLTSTSPLVIDTDGDYFNVTGTTGFATMTVAANRFFVLQFNGALVVTHGASIVIPGNANFTTSPGDQFQCFSIAVNTVQIVAITRANGTPVAINLVDDTSPQLGSFLDPKGNYVGSDKGGNLASASPLILGINGDYFDVTGTTGFSSITVATNRRFRLQFDGVLAITVGAGITLNNGGGNFTTGAGDIIDFQSIAIDIVVGTITKADGTSPVTADTGFTQETAIATTSGTSFNFGSIPSGITQIIVSFSGVSLSGSDKITVLLGDAGGLETSGYQSTIMKIENAVATVGTDSSTAFLVGPSGGAVNRLSGIVILSLLDSITNTWALLGGGSEKTDGMAISGGKKALSGELTQIEINRSGSDTFDAGLVNIQYI